MGLSIFFPFPPFSFSHLEFGCAFAPLAPCVFFFEAPALLNRRSFLLPPPPFPLMIKVAEGVFFSCLHLQAIHFSSPRHRYVECAFFSAPLPWMFSNRHDRTFSKEIKTSVLSFYLWYLD